LLPGRSDSKKKFYKIALRIKIPSLKARSPPPSEDDDDDNSYDEVKEEVVTPSRRNGKAGK
jgi:hypothetical protein